MSEQAPHASPLVLVGASDQALVVMDILDRLGRVEQVEAVIDASSQGRLVGSRLRGHEVRLTLADLTADLFPRVVVVPAVGSPDLRVEILQHARLAGLDVGTVIDPTSIVSTVARIEPGAVIGPRAVVGPETRIGSGTIVNSGAVIEHHGRIGAFCHVGPGAVLAGHVMMGDRATVGAGASVRDEVTVGVGATVGLGAAVVHDVPDGVTVVGVPATPLRDR